MEEDAMERGLGNELKDVGNLRELERARIQIFSGTS